MLRKFLLLSLVFLSACQPAKVTTGVFEVKDAWSRPSVSGGNGAVYLVIENGTSKNDNLLSARSDIASAVELHLSEMEGDHMSMRHQESVPVMAGEALVFEPGGLHVMLIGLTRELRAGETFEVTLVFELAGETGITVTVKGDLNND